MTQLSCYYNIEEKHDINVIVIFFCCFVFSRLTISKNVIQQFVSLRVFVFLEILKWIFYLNRGIQQFNAYSFKKKKIYTL